MEPLLEDYKRRLQTITSEIEKGYNEPTNIRLRTKASCYRTFISELETVQSVEPQEPKHVQDFMTDVHKWADSTFGTERTALAPLYHLKKEVDEAIETMQTHNQWLTIEELADCFILILNSSSKYGLTFDELFTAAKDKMVKNKSRKWGKPDKNGVVEHVRDQIKGTKT